MFITTEWCFLIASNLNLSVAPVGEGEFVKEWAVLLHLFNIACCFPLSELHVLKAGLFWERVSILISGLAATIYPVLSTLTKPLTLPSSWKNVFPTIALLAISSLWRTAYSSRTLFFRASAFSARAFSLSTFFYLSSSYYFLICTSFAISA